MLQTDPRPTRNRTTPPELDQIQGNLVGAQHAFQCFLFLRFPKLSQATGWVWLMSSEVATAQDVLDLNGSFKPSANIGLTYRGLIALGAPKIEDFPEDFKRGMRDAQTARANGDVDRSDPGRWVLPADRGEIHAVLLVGAETQPELDGEVSRQITALTAQGVHLLFKQDGERPFGPPRDQPLDLQLELSPGDLVIGYPLQPEGARSTGWPSPAGPTALYRPGQRAPRGPRPAWTVNGAYMVIRRLRFRSEETNANLLSATHFAHVRRIICRGVAFGKPLRDGADPTSAEGANAAFPNDRGLMLVFYQSSIHDKFEVLQEAWEKNASTRQYAVTTGGDYFFSPSVDALAMLGGERSPILGKINYCDHSE